VLVQGLPPDITDDELRWGLSRCGDVTGLRVYNRDGAPPTALGKPADGEDDAARESSSEGEASDEASAEEGAEGARSDCDEDDDDGDGSSWAEGAAVAWQEEGSASSAAHAQRGAAAAALAALASGNAPGPLVSAEEASGLSRKELKALKAARLADAKVAKAAEKAQQALAREAAKVARAEAREAAKVARAEAREAAKVARAAAKSKPGRKKGVKSVIAARALLAKKKSDCYAFVEFADPAAARRATAQTLQTFGICLGSAGCRMGEMCRTAPATDARSLYLYTPHDESVTSAEVEHWVNGALAPHLAVRTLRGRTSLLHEVTPGICRADFPSHEAAAWAFRQLDGQPAYRGEHLPSVDFGVQWMKVSEFLYKEVKTKTLLVEDFLFEK
jgi:hypothetical protein